jgi:hypothetical protein
MWLERRILVSMVEVDLQSCENNRGGAARGNGRGQGIAHRREMFLDNKSNRVLVDNKAAVEAGVFSCRPQTKTKQHFSLMLKPYVV